MIFLLELTLACLNYHVLSFANTKLNCGTTNQIFSLTSLLVCYMNFTITPCFANFLKLIYFNNTKTIIGQILQFVQCA